MANSAFALSPISARAASPNEADFEAIREAFVETARGRWFLEEYTRRNRNADTAMVLDAVARIEHTLAAQKEQRAEAPQEHPSELPAAMAAVSDIIAVARASAETALSGPVLDDTLAASRKCARVIREIAWGLRESGADGRICALLDSQVDAINAACDRMSASGIRDGVLSAFDQAAQQIEQITSVRAPHTEASQSTAAPAHVEPPVVSNDVIAFKRPAETPATIDEVVEPDSDLQEAASAGADIPSAEIDVQVDIAPQVATVSGTDSEQALAEAYSTPPEAIHGIVLDEELFDTSLEIGSSADTTTDTIVSEPLPVSIAASVDATDALPAISAEAAIVPAAEPMSDARLTPQASLGASLIANGIISKPSSPRSDPLAPIRRMSQAEKIAFFS